MIYSFVGRMSSVSFSFIVVLFFFFKQKTAYEMRISDWSSDVCSSDLVVEHADDPLFLAQHHGNVPARAGEGQADAAGHAAGFAGDHHPLDQQAQVDRLEPVMAADRNQAAVAEIGRAHV